MHDSRMSGLLHVRVEWCRQPICGVASSRTNAHWERLTRAASQPAAAATKFDELWRLGASGGVAREELKSRRLEQDGHDLVDSRDQLEFDKVLY